MKILEAISDTNIGGAGILLVTRLSCAPTKYKDYTTVILPIGSALTEKLKAAGVKFIEINACKNKSFSLIAVFKYVFLIKKLSPNIVNCHGNLSFRIAAFLCRVPVRLYTRHCSFPASKVEKLPFYKTIVGKGQSILSNGIIAVAYAAKNDLLRMGVTEDRIKVIINGARRFCKYNDEKIKKIKKEASIPLDATIISIFARLEPYKDHVCFLRAAKILSERGIDCYFLIVGGGSLECELKKYCEELGISEKTRFLGFTDDVEMYMNITDINVNCSIGTETASLALSEGMGISVPCVVSDFGGNPYMVQNQENGLVYPRGDSVALADSIEILCRDSALYQKVSQGAKKRFDNELNADHMTNMTYKYYELMLRSLSNKKGFFRG